jgi:release factor glutamine methyltransferase
MRWRWPSGPSSSAAARDRGSRLTVATWRELREQTERQLRALAVDAPDSEARWMIERVSGYDGVELVMSESEPATDAASAHVDDMVARRARGEPLQYVLGEWQFLGLDLIVDRRVLVPRPETEVVAQAAIDEAARLGARRGPPEPWTVVDDAFPLVDLGTGSGALALALATSLPEVFVWATDASDDALAVARANLAGTGVAATRVRLASGSWFDALPTDLRGRIRVIVANPPYIAEHEVPELPRDVIEWEPYGALVSGPTGMESIAAIVAGAPEWLDADGGALVVELAPHQAPDASARARAAGFHEVTIRVDLTGRDRVLVARLGG